MSKVSDLTYLLRRYDNAIMRKKQNGKDTTAFDQLRQIEQYKLWGEERIAEDSAMKFEVYTEQSKDYFVRYGECLGKKFGNPKLKNCCCDGGTWTIKKGGGGGGAIIGIEVNHNWAECDSNKSLKAKLWSVTGKFGAIVHAGGGGGGSKVFDAPNVVDLVAGLSVGYTIGAGYGAGAEYSREYGDMGCSTNSHSLSGSGALGTLNFGVEFGLTLGGAWLVDIKGCDL